MQTFILDEGNTLPVAAEGADKNGKVAPLDPNVELTWVADKVGLAAVFPVSGTLNCNFTYLGAGLVTMTCTGMPLGGTTAVSGQFQIQCNANIATHITFTASPEFITPVTP